MPMKPLNQNTPHELPQLTLDAEADGFYRLFSPEPAYHPVGPRPFQALKAQPVAIPQLSPAEVRDGLEKQQFSLIDVRDKISFRDSHLPGAISLTAQTLADFLVRSDKRKTYLIYCQHGYTSLGAAGYLLEKGFKDVFCLSGGFEHWRQSFPMLLASDR